jgi:hypothetical protein
VKSYDTSQLRASLTGLRPILPSTEEKPKRRCKAANYRRHRGCLARPAQTCPFPKACWSEWNQNGTFDRSPLIAPCDLGFYFLSIMHLAFMFVSRFGSSRFTGRFHGFWLDRDFVGCRVLLQPLGSEHVCHRAADIGLRIFGLALNTSRWRVDDLC